MVKTLLSFQRRVFKLIKAPASSSRLLSIGQHEPCLLTASFNIDGHVAQVIIDTGASISLLPEKSRIAEQLASKFERANMNAIMANDGVSHIDQKVKAIIKPTMSTSKPVKATFYIARGSKQILGHSALIGLNVLKLFDIQIEFTNNKSYVIHQGQQIGHEVACSTNYQASIIVDDRFVRLDANDLVKNILLKYRGVFADLDSQPIKGTPMRIFTVHQRPIFATKMKSASPNEIEQMQQHINELLHKGIIEPTSSGYAANSRIIPKKNGTGRLVINYIPLNAVTYRDSYALPNISNIIGVLQGNCYFSTMDCTQGFYQILLDRRDKHKTAFATPVGNYQFTRCPFGFRNSPAVFQSEMNRIFADGLYKRCVIYVDDILVFGKTLQEHNDNLAWVLEQCRKFNVKIKLEKCNFAKSEVKYLGFMISGSSIRPPSDVVQSISATKPPRDKTELKSIIGKLNFYSRFLPNYSKLCEPLRDLYMKNKDFQWTPYHQGSYDKLLTSLREARTQILCSRSQYKIIDLQVTDDSLEAALLDQQDQVIQFASRFMLTSEANYSFTEKQLLALNLAIKKFHVWIEPKKYVVRTSDKHLTHVMTLKNKPERVEMLLLKLPSGHDELTFEIKTPASPEEPHKLRFHVPQEIYYTDGACRRNGKPDGVAAWAVCAEHDRELNLSGLVKDANPTNNVAELTAAIKACEYAKSQGQEQITIVTDSRYLHSAATLYIDKWKNKDWLDHRNHPVVNVDIFKQLLDAKQGLQIEWIYVKGHNGHPGNVRADMLAKSLINPDHKLLACAAIHATDMQADDEDTVTFKEEIMAGKHPDYVVDADTIYYIDSKLSGEDAKRLYVPETSRTWLLRLAHDDPLCGGHLGIKKTYYKLIRFYWPRMYHHVEEYVRSCLKCQRFKSAPGVAPGYLHSIPVSTMFEHLHLDIVGPIHASHRGNVNIITATDALSKWSFTKAVQSVPTQEIIRFLEECIFSVHGRPQVIITDQGPQFTSGEWRRYMDKMQIECRMTTPYHPQGNGIDERVNGTLVRILRNYVDEQQTDWDDHLKWVTYLYNTTVHSSTGHSPYQFLHGATPRTPLSLNSDHKITDFDEIDKIRRLVRETASISNKQAQAKQQRIYNDSRRSVSYNIGDIVLTKEHVAPNQLSKKLYPRYSNPCVITRIIGESASPKAVTVVDCEFLTSKTVAIQNIKPYIERGEHQLDEEDLMNRTNERVGAHDDASLTGDNLYSSKYYESEDDNLSLASNEQQYFVDDVLDDQCCSHETLSKSARDSSKQHGNASARRITFSDDTTIIDYDNICEAACTTYERQPDPRYILRPAIDNSIDDPTYKVPTSQPVAVNESIRPITRSQQRSSTGSKLPKASYNLRSKPAAKSTSKQV